MAATSKITAEEFSALMERIYSFKENPRIAVAVSGGADSMALALLTFEWAKEHGASITALTVDHGLRKESRDEAAQVATWCESHGIAHHTLRWAAPTLQSAIQEQARDARYQLITQWCHEHNIPFLLSAHHQGDQAETLFFRLARGSGLDGLACMQAVFMLKHDTTLLRPLLSIPKARLIATLRERGQSWIEDPSNQNPNYTRNSIRAAIATTTDADSICERAYQLTQHFAKFRHLLEVHTAQKLAECVSDTGDGRMEIQAPLFTALEPEYGLRVIAAIVKQVGKGERKPRTEKLDRFYAQLLSDISDKSLKKRSFAHCIFRPYPKKGTIMVSAEASGLEKRNTPSI